MSMQMSGRNRLPGNSPHPTLSPLASGDRRSNRSGASLNYFRERSLFFSSTFFSIVRMVSILDSQHVGWHFGTSFPFLYVSFLFGSN